MHLMDAMTDFLFARPSYFRDMGRILDLGATMVEFNSSLSAGQADAIAIRSDFSMVAKDLRQAADETAKDLDRKQLALPL